MGLNVAIIGCGLIGTKRFKAMGPEHRLIATADVDANRAKQLGSLSSHLQYSGADWRTAVGRPDVDTVIVATTNAVLATIASEAVRQGKHVLVEKPAARNAAELAEVVASAKYSPGSIVKVGFNHRFHPAMLKAREIFDAGGVGPLMFIRGRYGHGGRVGYDREWRADPVMAGGGELLDQGVHLIDLSQWFLGEFTEAWGQVGTFFWDMKVDDNGFACLKTGAGQIAWLHASCSEWKNLFCLEIYGKTGKLQIDGLGGSYGVERLSYYRMLPQMGPPETTIWEYPGEDRSFVAEFAHFAQCVAEKKEPMSGLRETMAVLEIVQRIYDQNSRSDKSDPT